MHETGGWLLDARTARAFAAAWFVVALVYGLWRSRGEAKTDPIRDSGPVF